MRSSITPSRNTIPIPKICTCCTPSPTRCGRTRRDIGLGFDGDGDRCGVVDDTGEEIFADKVGVLLARDLSSRIPNAQFVVDVKSTGIYLIDPVLKKNGVQGRLLEDRPFLHQAPHRGTEGRRGAGKERPLFLQPAARPRL